MDVSAWLDKYREQFAPYEVPDEEREQLKAEGEVGLYPGDDTLMPKIERSGRKEFDQLKSRRLDLTGQVKQARQREKELHPYPKLERFSDKVLGYVPGILSPDVPTPEPSTAAAPSVPRGTALVAPKPSRFTVEDGEIIDTKNRQIVGLPDFNKLSTDEEKDEVEKQMRAGGYMIDEAPGVQAPVPSVKKPSAPTPLADEPVDLEVPEVHVVGERPQAQPHGPRSLFNNLLDDASKFIDEQKTVAQPKSPGEALRESVYNALQGAAQVPAGASKWIAIASKSLDDVMPESVRDDRPIEERFTYKLGKSIDDLAKRLFPADPELQKNFFVGTVPRAMGNMGGFFGGAALGALAKAPLTTGGLLGAQVGGTEQYEDAARHGASDDVKQKSFWLGSAAGVSEIASVGALLKRFNQATGGGFFKVLKEGGVTAAQEFTQEFFQNTANNITAQQLYDEQRSWLAGSVESGSAGGASGAVAGFISGLLQGRKARKQQQMKEGGASESPFAGEPTPTPQPQAPPQPATPDMVAAIPESLNIRQQSPFLVKKFPSPSRPAPEVMPVPGMQPQAPVEPMAPPAPAPLPQLPVPAMEQPPIVPASQAAAAPEPQPVAALSEPEPIPLEAMEPPTELRQEAERLAYSNEETPTPESLPVETASEEIAPGIAPSIAPDSAEIAPTPENVIEAQAHEAATSPTNELPEPTEAVKEPWEMSHLEFGKQRHGNPFFDKPYVGKSDAVYLGDVQKLHKRLVSQALRDRKPVPPEVLADYPDLQQGMPQAKAQAKAEAEQPAPTPDQLSPVSVPPRDYEGVVGELKAYLRKNELTDIEKQKANALADIADELARSSKSFRKAHLQAYARQIRAKVNERRNSATAPHSLVESTPSKQDERGNPEFDYSTHPKRPTVKQIIGDWKRAGRPKHFTATYGETHARFNFEEVHGIPQWWDEGNGARGIDRNKVLDALKAEKFEAEHPATPDTAQLIAPEIAPAIARDIAELPPTPDNVLEAQAHEAATSPTNELPEPTKPMSGLQPMATDQWPGSPEHAQQPLEPGRTSPAAIATTDDLGLTNGRYENSPSGHGRRQVFDFTGKIPEDPGYLYHVSPLDQFNSIAQNGLRSGKKTDFQKWEDGQNYFHGKLFASSDLSGVGSVIDAVYNVDAWALFRFKDDGKWRKGIEDDLYKNRGKVNPEDLEVWSGTSWTPILPNSSSPQQRGLHPPTHESVPGIPAPQPPKAKVTKAKSENPIAAVPFMEPSTKQDAQGNPEFNYSDLPKRPTVKMIIGDWRKAGRPKSFTATYGEGFARFNFEELHGIPQWWDQGNGARGIDRNKVLDALKSEKFDEEQPATPDNLKLSPSPREETKVSVDKEEKKPEPTPTPEQVAEPPKPEPVPTPEEVAKEKPKDDPNVGPLQSGEMSFDEFLQNARFYRSGKTKNAELPGGQKVILRQEATATNFRDISRNFLKGPYGSYIAKLRREKSKPKQEASPTPEAVAPKEKPAAIPPPTPEEVSNAKPQRTQAEDLGQPPAVPTEAVPTHTAEREAEGVRLEPAKPGRGSTEQHRGKRVTAGRSAGNADALRSRAAKADRERVLRVGKEGLPQSEDSQVTPPEDSPIDELGSPDRGATATTRVKEPPSPTKELADLFKQEAEQAKKSKRPVRPRIPVAPMTGGPEVKLSDIILDLSKGVGKKLATGKLKRGLSGVYKPGSTATLIKYSGDLDTTAHEIGHALDDQYGLVKDWNGQPLSPFDGELSLFAPHGSTSAQSSPTYDRAEGVAEYLRAWLVNPDAAEAAAPQFTAHVKEKLPKEIQAALKDFSTKVRQWAGHSAHAKIMANVQWETPDSGLLHWLTKGKNAKGPGFQLTLGDQMATALTDRLAPFMKAIKYAKGQRGMDSLLPGDDPAVLARLHMGINAKLDDIFAHGMVDSRLERATPGGIQWMLEPLDRSSAKALEADMQEVASLMIAQRTIEKAEQLGKKRVSGIGAGIEDDMAVAEARLTELKRDPERYERMREAAGRYRQWADANLRYLVDKGRLSEEQYEAIKENNEQYVAMQRILDVSPGEELVVAIPRGGAGRKLGSTGQPVQEFKGSSRAIKNPYLSLMDATAQAVREADRNEVLKLFRDMLTTDRGMYDGDPQELASVGRQAKSGEKHTLPIFINGTKEIWQFHPDVYKALKGVEEGEYKLPWLMTVLPRILRATIVNMPPFALRNIIRDAWHRSIISLNGSKPWDTLKRYSKEEVEQLKQAGGDQAGHYYSDAKNYARAMQFAMEEAVLSTNSIVVNPSKLAMFAKKGGQAYLDLMQGSERQGRLAEYRRAFRKAQEKFGYDDYHAMLYAASQSRSLIDYAVAGNWMLIANQLIPFSNAAVQGLRSSALRAKADPSGYALRFGAFALVPTLMTLAWNYLFDDDLDEYQQLPAYQRDLFWNFKFGPDLWLKIPKPFENGVLASSFERAVDYSMGNEKAFDGHVGAFLRTLLPVDEASLAGPYQAFVQAMMNYDFFRDRAIVPRWEENLDLDLRSYNRASRLGQALQEAIGVDARKIDFVIQQQFGYLGRYAADLSDIGRKDRHGMTVSATGMVSPSPATQSIDAKWVTDKAEDRGLVPSHAKAVARIRHVKDVPAGASKNPDALRYGVFRAHLTQYHKAESDQERDRLAQLVRDEAKYLRERWEKQPPRQDAAEKAGKKRSTETDDPLLEAMGIIDRPLSKHPVQSLPGLMP